MDESQAIRGFGALSQDTRLQILRLLVRAGPGGKPAGEIADSVGVSPSNVSFHLKELQEARLIVQRREARSIIYTAAYSTIAELIHFLMQDCCSGHPEICVPAIAGSCCVNDVASLNKEIANG